MNESPANEPQELFIFEHISLFIKMKQEEKNHENSSSALDFKQKNEKNLLFPWYDSYWLYSYVLVKNYLKQFYPERLQEFVSAFEVLRTRKDFKTLQLSEVFTKTQHEQIRTRMEEIKQEENEKHEFFEFGRIIKHDDAFFTTLQMELEQKVSEWAGEELECSYNFLSLYTNLGVLNPHIDAPAAKWTLDYCIEQSAPWPIHLSKVLPWPENWENNSENWVKDVKNDSENEFESFQLQEGNAIFFSGSSQWHYRERIQQQTNHNFCHLIFFHFIPKGTQALVHPRKWAAYFGIPELDKLVVDL